MTVAIIGAGLSGLFAASELLAAGIEDLMVLDEAADVGGIARTIEKDGFSFEPAAGSFNLPDPNLGPIFERAGVEVVEAIGPASRYVFRHGRLVVIPGSPRAILAPLLSWSSKLRVLTEPWSTAPPPEGDETLDNFLRRHFGREAGDMAAWLMASGVYAGDPTALSVASAFPSLKRLEEGSGSLLRGALVRRRSRPPGAVRPRLFTPKGGMTAVAAAIRDSLGDRYRSGFQARIVQRESGRWMIEGPERFSAEQVVMALRPERAAGNVHHPDLASHLEAAVSAPVVTMGIGGVGESPLPAGYGVLVSAENEMITRGLLFESSYAPDRAPVGGWLVKVIAGGAPLGHIVRWDDARLCDVVFAEVETILGSKLSPTMVEIIRHRPGIPQYVEGHGSWLAALDRHLAGHPGLHVIGWGYRGVGLSQIAADAAKLAATVAD